MAEVVSSSANYAPVYIERIVVRNFRGIEQLALEFEPGLTLLVGRNNVGKSRVLSALNLALGGRAAEFDDFTVGSDLTPEIDVVLAPLPNGEPSDEEAFTDAVGRRLDVDVQAVNEEPFRERFGWRTHVRPSAEGLGARTETRVLTYDGVTRVWMERSNANALTRDQRGLFAADYVATGRDLTDELGRRGSGIRRVLSDLAVQPEDRASLEKQLGNLSRDIVTGSATLAAIRQSLETLNRSVGSIGAPGVNALPVTLEELSRSLSFELDSGTGSLPIRLHGAGARSLASLQVQGVLYDRLLGADGGSMRPHPVTLVEEPEAHLHPQAAAELPGLLSTIQGQVIASTHSTHVVTSTTHRSVRLLREAGDSLHVVDLGPGEGNDPSVPRLLRPDLYSEEIEKIKRLVERPFGEVLFSSAIVVGDGATERALLPGLLRHALGSRGHGVCVVDPDSMAKPAVISLLKFAKAVGLPSVLFADADPSGRSAVENIGAAGVEPHVVWAGAPDEAAPERVTGAVEAMLIAFDSEMMREACERVRPGAEPIDDILKTMTKLKGSIGAEISAAILLRYPDFRTWPAPLRQLVEHLEKVLS